MYLTVSIRLTILAVTSRSTVERFHMIRLTEIEGEILVAASGDVAYQEFRSHFSSSSCTQFCPKLPGLAHATTCFATRRDDSTLSSAPLVFAMASWPSRLKLTARLSSTAFKVGSSRPSRPKTICRGRDPGDLPEAGRLPSYSVGRHSSQRASPRYA